MTDFVKQRIYTTMDATKPVVMVHLDAGHGGIVNGKYTTAPSKMHDFGDFVFHEGVFNRDIVKQLGVALWNENIWHSYTTTTNYDEPLADRIVHLSNVIKSTPANHHLLISIHGNAAGVEQANGWEFFTTTDITNSDFAAQYFVPYIYKLGMKFRINRAEKNMYDKETNFYIIRKAEALGCMAILTENGFFTNREEALKMLDPEWQKVLVDVIMSGIKDIITKIQKDGTIR